MGLDRRARIGEYIGSSTSGSVTYIDSNLRRAEDNSTFFWDAINKRISFGTTSNYTAKLNILAGSTTEKGLVIRVPGSYTGNFAEIQDTSGNVQLCIDSNYALACTATSTTQQVQVRSRPSISSVGGDFTFEIKRDGSNNNGNGAFLKFTDNSVSAYIKWISNSFTQNVMDLEIHNTNGKVYSAPSTGGNFYYNPVVNTQDLSILRIPTQTLSIGAGTPSPQGLFRVTSCTTGATSPVSVTDVAMFWVEGAPVQGVNTTLTNRYAALIGAGDAAGKPLAIRGYTSQTANLTEWQDVSSTTLTSIDSAGRINLHAQNEIRFQDSAGGQYAAIKAPATIASSYTLTLPDTDGGANEYLQTDGNGVLSWASASSTVSIGSSITGSTDTSVLYVDSSLQLAEDPTHFSYNETNATLQITGNGTATNQKRLVLKGSTSQSGAVMEIQNSAGTATWYAYDNGEVVHSATGTNVEVLSVRSSVGASILAIQALNSSSSAQIRIRDTSNIYWEFGKGILDGTTDLNFYDYTVGGLLVKYAAGDNSGGGLVVTPTAVGRKGIQVKGYNGQTANLQEWQNYTGTAMSSIDASGRLNLHLQNEVRFQDASGGEYAAIKAPATIGSSYTLTLPTTDGGANEYLKSDGSGGLSWDTPGGTPSMARTFAFMGA